MKPPTSIPHLGGGHFSQGASGANDQLQQQLQQQLQAAMGQLSLGIYAQLATAQWQTLTHDGPIDQDRLQRLAKDSQTAARCYFEGIGVIQQGDKE